MIKLLKQYPLIGMIVGSLGISVIICTLFKVQLSKQMSLLTLQTDTPIAYASFEEGEPQDKVHTKEEEGNERAALELEEDTLDSAQTFSKASSQIETVNSPIEVPIYICGAVNKPGVYYVFSDAIIDEVVQASGGFTSEADVEAVNLASPIIPHEKIIIPKIGEQIDKPLESYDNRMDNVIAKDDMYPAKNNIAGQDANSAKKGQNSCININSASKEILMTLPGIGEVKANAIITYRQEHGSFKNKEELTSVTGIGEKTYEKLAQLITVE